MHCSGGRTLTSTVRRATTVAYSAPSPRVVRTAAERRCLPLPTPMVSVAAKLGLAVNSLTATHARHPAKKKLDDPRPIMKVKPRQDLTGKRTYPASAPGKPRRC